MPAETPANSMAAVYASSKHAVGVFFPNERKWRLPTREHGQVWLQIK